MGSVFKYFDKESYAASLIERGELYLQTLAHFRLLEDGLVRGDPDDGKLRYRPNPSLALTKTTGETIILPPEWQFRSSVRAEDIYVYCLSLERSELLAERFGSAFCVEINDADALFRKLKGATRLRSRLDRNAYRGPVEYRDIAKAPGADWALPEKVAFLKPPAWEWQAEYRMVLGRKGALTVEQVEVTLQAGENPAKAGPPPRPLTLRVGDLSHIAGLHRF